MGEGLPCLQYHAGEGLPCLQYRHQPFHSFTLLEHTAQPGLPASPPECLFPISRHTPKSQVGGKFRDRKLCRMSLTHPSLLGVEKSPGLQASLLHRLTHLSVLHPQGLQN